MKYKNLTGVLTILLILAGLILPIGLVAEEDQDDKFLPELQSCDDVRDYLEAYLAQYPEPRQAEVDDLMESMIPACPCDTYAEKQVVAGFELLDALLFSGFPVEMSMNAVSRGCDLRASQIAVLYQVLAPNIGAGSGGPQPSEQVSAN